MSANPTSRTLQPYPDLPPTVAEAGAARPALILHGGAGPDSVADIAAHLAATHRVLTPTHPGWDDTPRPDWFAGIGVLVETYHDLLDDRDLRDVTVLGSSFGGWVAAELALRDRGRRIGRLILLDAIGPVIPGQEVRTLAGPPPGAGRRRAAPRRGPSPANMAALRAYAGAALAEPTLLPRLARVALPVLAVWGEDDAVVTPDFGRAYAAAFPDSRFAVIDGFLAEERA